MMKRLSILCMGFMLMSKVLFADPIFSDSFEYNDWNEAVAAGWSVSYGNNAATEVSFVTSAPNAAGVTDGAKALKIDVPGDSTNMGIIHPFASTLQREWTLSFDWYLSGTSTGELPETGMRTQVKVKSSVNSDEVGFWIQYNSDGGNVYPRTLDFIVNTAAGGNSNWIRIDKLYNAGETPTGDFPFALQNGWNHFVLTSKADGDLDTLTVTVNSKEIYSVTGAYGIAMDQVLLGYWNKTYVNKDGYFDDLKMSIGSIWGAHDPSPSNQVTRVLPTDTLTWQAGLDPNDLTRVSPKIKTHYVWLSNGDVGDPNLFLVDTIAVTDYSDPSAGCSYTPATALNYDSTYYWMIEEGLDNGAGGVYPAGDANNRTQLPWSFQTMATVPVITLQPVSVKVDSGMAAQLNIGYASVSTVTNVTWYKDGSPLAAGGNVSIVWDQSSSVLSFSNVDSAAEGEYYAIVSNGNDSDPSDTVVLTTKKLLAWYKFEQDFSDSAGSNNGTVSEGDMDYVAGKISSDDQSYAISPNGTNYATLTTDAYPKAGFGNGLDAFTYSCWVNVDPGEKGILFGSFNSTTATSVRVTVSNGVNVYLRQDGGLAINPATAPLAADSNWHFITVTYDGSLMKVYVDGVAQKSATNILTNFANWEYPMVIGAVNYRGSINDRYNGQLDDLKIYNYAFSKDEVAQSYLSVEGGWICDSEQPELVYDLDNNCQVDLGDFAIFVVEWLDSNRIYAQ
ncbi:MAG: immunoglobulin domain-containing protein [Sedimentisphaerales bacterium]|nr:immunoglobulin domain-containing protein [Sedimentisphaerales bacterium]